MEHPHDQAPSAVFSSGNRFLILIILSIAIAMILVSVSIALYASSGAAQLDLSRPGYRAVSSKAEGEDKTFEMYSTIGELNEEAINEFRILYDTQATKAKAVDAYSGDPLNPEVLEISEQ